MISWREKTDFEVYEKKKKNNLGTCGEKTSNPRSYEGGSNIIFVFQNHPWRSTHERNFPMRLSQAVASSLNVQSDFLSHGLHIFGCGGPTVKDLSSWILVLKDVLESILHGYWGTTLMDWWVYQPCQRALTQFNLHFPSSWAAFIFLPYWILETIGVGRPSSYISNKKQLSRLLYFIPSLLLPSLSHSARCINANWW